MVDLALYWTKPSPMGSNVDSVVEASLEVIEAARGAGLPIFFSTWDFDPDVRPPRPPHPPTTLRGEHCGAGGSAAGVAQVRRHDLRPPLTLPPLTPLSNLTTRAG